MATRFALAVFSVGAFRVYLGVPLEGWLWGYDAWWCGHDSTVTEVWGLGPLLKVVQVTESP